MASLRSLSWVLLRGSLTSPLRRPAHKRSYVHLERYLSYGKYGSVYTWKTKQTSGNELGSHRVSSQRFLTAYPKLENNQTVVPVFLRAEEFRSKTAVTTHHGHYTYDDLPNYSANLSRDITLFLQQWTDINPKKKAATRKDGLPLGGERIAFLCENDMSYIVAQWATWMCGAIAVPLCKSHPTSELEYFVQDSDACLILCTDAFKDKVEAVATTIDVPYKVIPEDAFSGDYDKTFSAWTDASGSNGVMGKSMYSALKTDAYKDRKAIIIYTSGTTGRPKGAVHTFGNLNAQMQSMISAWGWTPDDVILHVLPLHHVHGVVNVLMTSLYCGATCVMMPNFDAKETWQALTSHDPTVNLFMAVPTVYAKLIEEYDNQLQSGDPYLPSDLKDILLNNVRLMVSGSAALPQPIMEKWKAITGHTLLERYGMTEIGMALTNPLLSTRTPGEVGLPFPGVEVAVVGQSKDGDESQVFVTADAEKVTVTPGTEGESGELLVKGDNVFREYWNRPAETAETFTPDGWFKTGDTAVFTDNVFRIVGRTSVDVIKSGGYKISALDVERHLLSHPDIRDVAVIGLPDEKWGQLVTAVVVVKEGTTLTLDELKDWAKDRMATYHVPKVLKCLPEMPRNAMGKVNKKQLAKDLFPEHFDS